MSAPGNPLAAVVRRGYIAVGGLVNVPASVLVYIGDDSVGSGGTTPQPCPYMRNYVPQAGDYVLLLGSPGAYTVMGSLSNTSAMPPPSLRWFPRASALAQDNVAANVWTDIADGTWTNAPAGRYLVGENITIDNTGGATVMWHRLTANGASISNPNGYGEDIAVHVSSTYPISHHFSGQYDHSGGNLQVIAWLDSTGGVGRVYRTGTNVWMLGPFGV